MPNSCRKMLEDMMGALCFLASSRIFRVPSMVPPMGLSQKVGSPRWSPGETSSKWSSPYPDASPIQIAST